MTVLLPMLLAAAAAALLAAPVRDGAVRLREVAPAQHRSGPPVVAAAVLAAIAACLVLGPVPAVLCCMCGVLLHRTRRRSAAAAAGERERERALDALSMLAADLRTGRTPADAFDAAAGIACGGSAAAFAAAAAAARLGGDVGSALTAEHSSVTATLSALAACWQVCSDAGHGLAAAVERLEDGLRAAEAQRRSVAAELAGPRASAQLLAVLPVAGVALAAGLGAHPLDVLFGTPVGVGCLAAGLTLDGLGVVWTRRLTERAMP